MIKLSIAILSYNTKDLVLNCLRSLTDHYKSELERGEFEIILVDNASADGTVDQIQNSKFQIPNFKIIRNKKNYGFSKGNNIAAKTAEGKYVLFLNSDTEVYDRKFLKMIEFLEKNKNVQVLGGKLTNIDGSSQPSAGKFYNLFNLFLMLIGGERFGMVRENPQEIKMVDWVSGACMMVRRDFFNKIGGFDENLFMYMEDMEFCFRVKKHGFETYFYPDLRLIHKERGSGNKTFAILNIYKGILYFYKKHKSKIEYNLARILLGIKAVTAFVLGMIIGNTYLKKTYKETLILR